MVAQGKETNLENLPLLATETIVQCLDLAAIKSLRLSCKALSERCMGPHFKSFFCDRRTDLTKESLESLRALASHPKLGHAVKNLTVMAVMYDPSKLNEILSSRTRRVVETAGPIRSVTYERCTEEEINKAKSDLEWLQAQRNAEQSDASVIESLVSAMRLFGKLDSIHLAAGIVQTREAIELPPAGDWYETWTRAFQVYCLTMTAAARSGIAVDTLTVYRDTLCCSVQACRITAHMASLEEPDRLSFARNTIKNFALSVSPEITSDFDSETLAGHDGYGIKNLLELMPNLETLDLHLYRPRKGKTTHNERVMEEVAQEVHLPRLKRCSLNGIFPTEETMLQFLKKYPQINHLTLREVNLVSGSWTPIFEYLSCGMPALTFLRLSNLWTNGNLINLKPVWCENSLEIPETSWYMCEDGIMVHTHDFDAEDLKRGLEFRPGPDGTYMGSPQLMYWMTQRRAGYGPP